MINPGKWSAMGHAGKRRQLKKILACCKMYNVKARSRKALKRELGKFAKPIMKQFRIQVPR